MLPPIVLDGAALAMAIRMAAAATGEKTGQIESCVFDMVRSYVPRMELDECFACEILVGGADMAFPPPFLTRHLNGEANASNSSAAAASEASEMGGR